MSWGILFTVAVVIFLAELPDKSMFASLVLGTRYRPVYVWLGVAAAFLIHVVIAVAAGGVLHLLPRRLVEGVVAVLFLLGAFLVLRSDDEEQDEAEVDAANLPVQQQFWRVFLTSFSVVFVGEWGDITQIATANYAARYDPLTVGVGAVVGLWLVSGLGVSVGARLLRYVPMLLMQRVTATILAVFGVISAVAAITG